MSTTGMSQVNLVRVENVCKQYQLGEETVHAVKNVSFTVEDRVFLAIAGPPVAGSRRY